jgi:hypothetical protein
VSEQAADLTAELATFDRQAALEAIPLDVLIDDDVDLDSEDPARTEDGKRVCVSVRRAGGRCRAVALHSGLLCSVHLGLLDPAEGGRAKGRKLREQEISDEEAMRLARLGARGLIADRFTSRPAVLARVVDTLMDMAAAGDQGAAKALIPYMNQGFGAPTERVEMLTPESRRDIEAMPTDQLADLVQRKRRLRLAAAEDETAEAI